MAVLKIKLQILAANPMTKAHKNKTKKLTMLLSVSRDFKKPIAMPMKNERINSKMPPLNITEKKPQLMPMHKIISLEE